MQDFLPAFWPSLASTILGLVLGLPLALWTNRLILQRGQRAELEVAERRLHRGLGVIAQALAFNRAKLAHLRSTLADGKVLLDLAVDYSAWEASHGEIMPLLHDAELKQRLAYHFSRLHALTRLTDTYLNYAAGVASALGGSERTRDSLRSYLIVQAEALEIEADELVRRIGDHPSMVMRPAEPTMLTSPPPA